MASVVLPQVVAVCIQHAIESGRTLSWRIPESFKGTSVQLFWNNDYNQESRVEQAYPWSRRARSSKKKSPSQVRRSRRCLDEFIKSKSQDCQPKYTLEITQDNRACTNQFVGHAADSGYVRLMTETSTTFPEQQATKLPLQVGSSSNSNRTAAHSTKSVPPSSQQLNQLEGKSCTTSTQNEPKKMVSPNHLRTCQTSMNSATIDLSKCFSKCFEKGENGVPGIRYRSSTGSCCWSPVSKSQVPQVDIPYQVDDTSLEDLMSRAKDVSYCEIQHHPGLKVCTGCASKNIHWVPITASPVAHRTRSRTKIT